MIYGLGCCCIVEDCSTNITQSNIDGTENKGLLPSTGLDGKGRWSGRFKVTLSLNLYI